MNITWVQFFLAIIGSSGLFAFIQFLIQRKDNNNNYINEIRKEYRTGLKECEDINKTRYEEQQELIRKLNDAISQLTKNDSDINEYLHYMGDELMGLAHDKLVFLTDKFQKRGAITLKEKATLNSIYEPYSKGLHGNGDGKTGYEYAMQLPVVTDKEAEIMDKERK